MLDTEKSEMDDPVKRILNALNSNECRSKNSFEYSLFLTIRMSDLCFLFFKYLMKTDVKNNIIKHIKVKLQGKEESLPKDFIKKLLVKFKNSKQRRRISLGTAIKVLKDSFTKQQLKSFFDEQILSENISDRKRAYVICQDIYDEDVDDLLWKSWDIYHDNNCMDVLSKNTKAERLISHFNEIWTNEDLKFFIKNNALKRVAAHNIDSLEFLKKKNLISYLSACVAAKQSIGDELAQSIAKSTNKISAFNYVLWCLGMLGKDKVLYNLLSEATDIETNMPIEDSEYITGEYY